MSYPNSWPKASSRTDALASKVTEEQKEALYNRKITTRELAKLLRVNESYLSSLFPTKAQPDSQAKRVLIAIRKEFRQTQAVKVAHKQLTTEQAALICRTSYRTMARAVQLAREGEVNAKS